MNEPTTVVTVRPDRLLDVLLERNGQAPADLLAWLDSAGQNETPRRAVVASDGMKIAIVESLPGTWSWQVAAMHCASAAHGTHWRYDRLYDKVRGKLPRKTDCDHCDGSGWIAADTEEGRRLIVAAQTFRIYRGVRLAEDGYKTESLDASTLKDAVTHFVAGMANQEVKDAEEG